MAGVRGVDRRGQLAGAVAGGRLAPQVLYSRWVPAAGLRPAAGCRYDEVPRLRLDGPAEGWPAPAVAPDGSPWYGERRVYEPLELIREAAASGSAATDSAASDEPSGDHVDR